MHKYIFSSNCEPMALENIHNKWTETKRQLVRLYRIEKICTVAKKVAGSQPQMYSKNEEKSEERQDGRVVHWYPIL
jgi:hypothetical protein